MHWAADYIGLGWEYGATGPLSYDCWNFVREVQESRFNVQLPVIQYRKDWMQATEEMQHHPEHQNWMQVDSPEEGDIVMMARNRLPLHIGVWIKANMKQGVLHCAEPGGVTFQTRSELQMMGWGNLKFFRHKS